MTCHVLFDYHEGAKKIPFLVDINFRGAADHVLDFDADDLKQVIIGIIAHAHEALAPDLVLGAEILADDFHFNDFFPKCLGGDVEIVNPLVLLQSSRP